MRTRLALFAAAMVAAVAAPPRAQAPPQLRLEGIVEDGRAQPLPAAEVRVEHDGVEIARTATDGTGWFLFGRLPVANLVVHARTDARAGAERLELTSSHMIVRVRTWPTRKL